MFRMSSSDIPKGTRLWARSLLTETWPLMTVQHLKRNASVAQLYEDAIQYEGAVIASSGALINYSGKKTGRSPKDKRIVYEETSKVRFQLYGEGER